MISAALNLREIALGIFEGSLADCSIQRAFFERVKSHTDETGERHLHIGENSVHLDRLKHIRVIAAGKAAGPMLEALLPHLRNLDHCSLSGILVTTDLPVWLPDSFQFFAGGHPLPNESSINGARAALDVLESLKKESPDQVLCLFLISGGASAMMELPLDPTISLEDTVSFYRELVHSGASIAEINCVRKHFSAIKGGRLALKAEGIPSYSLLISDVPPGHLDALASGPTLPDPSTVGQCQEILVRHGMMKRFPESICRFFSSPALPETPKEHQLKACAITLMTSDDIAEAARQRAQTLGFYTEIDNTCDDWEYRRAAIYLLNRLNVLRQEHTRVCLIFSGEVRVEIPEESLHHNRGTEQNRIGVGGRNQQFALYAATLLSQSSNSTVILSAGTDGIDGNSTAAGAIVGELTLSVSGDGSDHLESSLFYQAEQALQCFDSGTFLETVDSTIVTGPTGNNLRDLRILMAE